MLDASVYCIGVARMSHNSDKPGEVQDFRTAPLSPMPMFCSCLAPALFGLYDIHCVDTILQGICILD